MLAIFIANLRGVAQPPDVFHDPNAIALISVGVGVAGIIAAALIGIYQVRQGRTWRRLEYHRLSNGPIVTVNSTVANQVEIDIRVNGVVVKDAHLMVLLIKNSGKESIHAADYFEPLTFEFDTKVLNASVIETTPPALINPKDMSTFLTLAPQSVQFPTFSFNPNDAVQLSVLLEGEGRMKVRGRLDQGSIIAFESEEDNGGAALILAAITVIVVTGSIALVAETMAILGIGLGTIVALVEIVVIAEVVIRSLSRGKSVTNSIKSLLRR